MVKQCTILFGCLALGDFVVWATGVKLPGSIIGMLLLLADGMGKAALGQGYLRFLSKQHGVLFRSAGSGPDALFRCDCR